VKQLYNGILFPRRHRRYGRIDGDRRQIVYLYRAFAQDGKAPSIPGQGIVMPCAQDRRRVLCQLQFARVCVEDPDHLRDHVVLAEGLHEADVAIDGKTTASIGAGILALVGVRPADTEESASRLLNRMLQYRIFSDEAGKMNRSLVETQGSLLLVPQFTLAADTRKGLRPGFSGAAPPEQGRLLFDALLRAARAQYGRVESGVFGAHMQVSLTNDGPVTIWLES